MKTIPDTTQIVLISEERVVLEALSRSDKSEARV